MDATVEDLASGCCCFSNLQPWVRRARALARSRWSKATYGCGCAGRSPSLKTLIRCWNLLQDLSTLFLQSAFFIENWRSAILHGCCCFSNLQPWVRRANPYPGAVGAKRLTDVVAPVESPSLKTVRALSESF